MTAGFRPLALPALAAATRSARKKTETIAANKTPAAKRPAILHENDIVE
ncbi:hypothetical protein [Methylobacterium nodulans]|nr:hypothetical protein [Methylobacterium nodulans]